MKPIPPCGASLRVQFFIWATHAKCHHMYLVVPGLILHKFHKRFFFIKHFCSYPQLLPNVNEAELIPKYSLLVVITSIGSLIFAPLGGLMANWLGRKRPFLIASVITLAASCSLYSMVSLAREYLRYPLLAVARFTAGASLGKL